MPTLKAWTLRLVFDGVCGFVPDTPFFVEEKSKPGHYKPGSPTKLAVLLPDMRYITLANWEGTYLPQRWPYLSAAHVPLLTLNPYDIQTMDPPFSMASMATDPVTGQLRLVHLLDYQAVSFKKAHKWQALTFEHRIPRNQEAQKPPNSPKNRLRRSLWWLPRMKETSPSHDYACADLLSGKPGSFSSHGLAGRVEVPGGHLSVSAINSDDEGTKPWSFAAMVRKSDGTLSRNKPYTWNRAVATQVRCDIGIDVANLRLCLWTYNDEEIEVTLQPAEPGGVVEVRIANAELDALMLKPGTLKSAFQQPDNDYLVDVDFQALYKLTTAAKTVQAWPVPFRYANQKGYVEKPCAGGAFSGSAPRPKQRRSPAPKPKVHPAPTRRSAGAERKTK